MFMTLIRCTLEQGNQSNHLGHGIKTNLRSCVSVSMHERYACMCGCSLALDLALTPLCSPFLLPVYLVGAAQTAQLC